MEILLKQHKELLIKSIGLPGPSSFTHSVPKEKEKGEYANILRESLSSPFIKHSIGGIQDLTIRLTLLKGT